MWRLKFCNQRQQTNSIGDATHLLEWIVHCKSFVKFLKATLIQKSFGALIKNDLVGFGFNWI